MGPTTRPPDAMATLSPRPARAADSAPERGRRGWLTIAAVIAVAATGAAVAWSRPAGWAAVQEPAGTRRDVSVSARRYDFSPARIQVDQNDLVKISFTAEDIAHSFTVDAYRIAKRANPGQTVTFEFRADQPGTFRYYCNLAIDDGCRQMHGELIVRAR